MAPLGSLEPLRTESTASMIAEQVREAIMLGELTPGAQIGEAEVAARLRVSRGPVREALHRLVQEGILVAIRNRGVFVPELGEPDVKDIYLAREAVECAAAQVLIARGGTRLEGLERILQKMDSAIKSGRWSTLAALDIEFHQELIQATDSQRLHRMLGTLILESRLCVLALEGGYRASADLVEEHREIFDAIKRGDEDVAISRIREHMRDAVLRLSALFAERALVETSPKPSSDRRRPQQSFAQSSQASPADTA